MSYYLDIEQQIKNIFAEIDINEIKSPSCSPSTILTDITDGILYKKLLESEDGISFKKR